MGVVNVMIVFLVGLSIHALLAVPMKGTSKKNNQLSEMKGGLHVGVQLLSKPNPGQIPISNLKVVQSGASPIKVKSKRKIIRQTTIIKKKKKPGTMKNKLAQKGINLRAKVKHALNTYKNKAKANKKKLENMMKKNPKSKGKQIRNFRFRSRPQKKGNRKKKRINIKRNWRKGRKFPKRRLVGQKGKKGKVKIIRRKKPRNLKLKLMGLKRRGRLLNAIRSAIGSIQRQTKAKKKSKMSTGYLRRLVGIPSKRFKGSKLKKLKLKDVLQKAGIELPRKQTKKIGRKKSIKHVVKTKGPSKKNVKINIEIKKPKPSLTV